MEVNVDTPDLGHLLEKREIYNEPNFTIYKEKIRLPSGTTIVRSFAYLPQAVAIIAITQANEMVFVTQYRPVAKIELMEVPAGKVEEGESPEQCAERELLEETGYMAEEITHLTSFYSSPGSVHEIIHLFYAKKCKKVTDETDKRISLHLISIDEVLEQISDIYDAKSLISLLWFQLLMNDTISIPSPVNLSKIC